MKALLRVLFAGTMAATGLVSPASATETETAPCLPKQALEHTLAQKYGESGYAMGLANSNAVKFFANPQSQTWTIVVITPAGTACVIASGEDFEWSTESLVRPSKMM